VETEALDYAPPIAELRMGGPLSAAQLRSFAEEGVLILESFVDEATLQLWDAQMAEQLEGDPADSATWAGGPANPQLTPALKDLPQMQAVLRQLGAGGWGGGSGLGGVKIKGNSQNNAGNMRPRADAVMGGSGNMRRTEGAWKAPDLGHIDGYVSALAPRLSQKSERSCTGPGRLVGRLHAGGHGQPRQRRGARRRVRLLA